MSDLSSKEDLMVEVRNDSQETPPARQITKENVSKLDSVVVDLQQQPLSSTEGGIQSERSSQYLERPPLRESSSAFLASLTSASDISSPMTSAFPSTDSLQSSDPGKDDDGLARNRHGLIEMAAINNLHAPVRDSLSISSTSRVPIESEIDQTIRPSTQPTTATSSPTEYQYKTPTNHDRILHDLDIRTPSRNHTPSQSALSTPGEHIRPESHILGHEYYSSGKHDEEHEQSHSKTPLLYPTDYPAPKETNQAIKEYDPSGAKLINQYETIGKLGQGAHGSVKLGKDRKTQKLVAIKVVRRYPKRPRLGKHESPEEKVKKEVAVLKKAQHPHVVSLLEVIDDPSNVKIYLILEYVELGEIKWRKQTTRDIANFEMNRMRREITGHADEIAETENLLIFNDSLMQQFLEKQARSVIGSSASESYPDEHEFMEYHERRINRIPSRHSSRPSSRPTSRPPSELDISATHTLRVPSRASQRDNHGFEHDLTGSIYGSYIEEETMSATGASDFERERWLRDEPALEEQWSPEEEEYRFVPCLTLSEARDVFRDTVRGLEYLHHNHIIHRDIKPANLLWTKERRVKISDFGVSYLGRPLSDEGDEESNRSGEDVSIELAKTVGTPAFYAPELCDPDLFDAEKNITKPRITGQIDVWALGITLYGMIYGRLPFYDQNEFTMYEKIARAEPLIPSKRLRGVYYEPTEEENVNKREEHVLMYEDVDQELRDLISKLLIKDPTKRMSIKQAKNHPWTTRGFDDPAAWIKETDPNTKPEATTIKISDADVSQAVVPRTFLGKVWNTVQQGFRGRVPSRKRPETSGKNQVKRVTSLSRSSTATKDERRASLRGDEAAILELLQKTRDPADHPLSKSTAATPMGDHRDAYFPPIQQVDSSGNLVRPPVRTATTADSILTVRPHRHDDPFGVEGQKPSTESAGSSSSSLAAKLIDNTKVATRRFTSKVRGRDPQNTRVDDADISSSASSGDNITLETRPMKPSLAVSPALAAGHVEPPAGLHLDSALSSPHTSPIPASIPSTDSFQNLERGRTARKRASTASTTSWGQLSPGLHDSYRARLASITGTGHHPAHNNFLPLTGNTSWPQAQPFSPVKQATPIHAATSDAASSLLTTGETITPAIMKQKEEERQRYNYWRAEQQHVQRSRIPSRPQSPKEEEEDDQDDGSDDEGIMMGGGKK